MDWDVINGEESVVVTQTSNPLRIQGNCHYEAECAYFWENEVRMIEGLEPLAGGKTRITLDRPLDFAHQGSGETRGEVGLLTRNVLVRTEILGLDQFIPERRFAHTMLMGTATGKIQYAEFKYMGQLGALARYPVHVHMTAEAGIGVIIRGNSVWRSGNRGYQVHGTQGVLVEDNLAFDTVMTPYYFERSPEAEKQDPLQAPWDNWLVHNLGVQATTAPNSALLPAPGRPQQNDPAIFWFDGIDQVFLGNVAVGGGANGGSGVPEGGDFPGDQEFQHAGVWIDSKADGTGGLRAPIILMNEAHSNSHDGLGLWQKSNEFPVDVVDVKSWRNGLMGIHWGYYRSFYKVYQAQIIENQLGISAKFAASANRYVQDAELIGNQEAIRIARDVASFSRPDTPIILRPIFGFDFRIMGQTYPG